MSDTPQNATLPPTATHARPAHTPMARPRQESINEARYMRATIAIFRRHLRLFLGVAVVVPLSVWIAIAQTAPQYTATGALIYDPSEYKARELQSILHTDPTTEAVMASQAEILQSMKVAQRVADRGNLYANPQFNASLAPPSTARRAAAWLLARVGMASGRTGEEPVYGPTLDPARDATVQAVRAALHAAPVRFSRVMEVTFAADQPTVAAAAVNNAMDIYIKDQYAAKGSAIRHATRLLDERAKTLREEVRKAEDRNAAYRAEHRFAQGMHAGLDAERITHLNEDLIRARADLAAADSRVDSARGRNGAMEQAAIASSVVPLRTNLEQLAAQYESRKGRLGANHPEADAARRQADDARRAVNAEIARVVTAAEADRRAAVQRVAALERNLTDARREADAEAKAQIPLNAMQRDTEALRAELQAVLERIQQTAQQSSIEMSEAHEISLALPPRQPSWPRSGPMMGAGVAAGVLMGLLAVYLRHLIDATIRSGEDIRTLANLPCFALLPELTRRDLRNTKIEDYAIRRPLTAFAEQVRAVRAGLWFGSQRPRVVAITAARPDEGKSLLALSLARSAAMGGEKVLLIDCDIRRPALAHRLRADNSAGLSELLGGKASLTDVLHRDPSGGMHFIPAGKPAGDSFGLFMGPEMAQLLNDARDEYALIILDSPPVQAITEARVLAAVADAAVLCVRWRSTPRDVVRYSLELLEEAHAHVAGAVLTRVDPRAHVRSGYADAEVYHPRYKAYHAG